MANFLRITKEPNDYFTFVLNGDSANGIKNTRNDLLTVGNLCHFKTSNGANLISEQNILYSNVTIIDGITTLIPISIDDLFVKLISVNYFDWINGTGGGGADRFDELEDTFTFIGRNGQVPVVNESELRLDSMVLPDVSYLNYLPTPLQPLKSIRVKADNSGYEFFDPVNVVTQTILAGNTTTAPSEDAVYNALQVIQSSIVTPEPQSFTALTTGINQTFTITGGYIAKTVYKSKGLLYKTSEWTQSGSTLTIIPNTNTGSTIYVEF